ncbi:MAG: hypothetical protein CMG07_02735 [Candidatus Marinimicrobia bacterium]|nr:hypothetical protein [Candidatus Neomarinimicrobiota bacterium]
MNFIFSSLLLALPLVLLPFIIHLLNKRNVKTVKFSSIRFLKLIEKDSINKLKLIQLILLIIRTLIVFFIIIMLSRPVIKGLFSGKITNNNSTLSLIYIDDTASNSGIVDNKERKELIDSYITDILSQISDNSAIVVLTQSKGVIYEGIKSNLYNLLPIEVSKSYGGIKDRLNIIENYLDYEKYSNIELFLISDGEESFFNFDDSDKLKLKNLYIYFLQIPSLMNNFSITDVKISNSNISINEQVEFLVTVRNNGKNKIKNSLLEFKIDKINVGQQLISIEPNNSKVFNFKTSFPSTGKYQCIFNIPNDDNFSDNFYYYLVDIPEKLKIGLIDYNNIYIKEIINSINENNKNIEIYNFNNEMDLYELDVAFISSNSLLNDKLLNSYINEGGHLIYFPSSQDIDIDENIKRISNLNSIINYNEHKNGTYNSINTKSIGIPYFYNSEKLYNQNNLEFYKYLIFNNDTNSYLELANSISIWKRYNIKDGIFDIFGFANDLNWTNLPLKGSYINFINKLINTKSNYTINNTSAGQYWNPNIDFNYVNKNLYYQFNDIKELVIANDIKISIKSNGFHTITSNSQIIKAIAANINIFELKNKILDEEDIKILFPNNVIFIKDDISDSIERSKYGYELWRIILYIIIFLIILEMIISNGKRFQKN